MKAGTSLRLPGWQTPSKRAGLSFAPATVLLVVDQLKFRRLRPRHELRESFAYGDLFVRYRLPTEGEGSLRKRQEGEQIRGRTPRGELGMQVATEE